MVRIHRAKGQRHPLLLYYGDSGFKIYGYRYTLDVTPFLLALVAMGARRHFGALEKLLIGLSVAFVAYASHLGLGRAAMSSGYPVDARMNRGGY